MTLTATIIGSGPNGLAAGVLLARAGVKVTIFEGASIPGGGLKTEHFGPDGFIRDVCSAVHPLVLPSPFLNALGVTTHVDYAVPEISYAQALSPGTAVLAYRDIERTSAGLGKDGDRWYDLFSPLSNDMHRMMKIFLNSPFRASASPLFSARVGLTILKQSKLPPALRWQEESASALFAGVAAHAGTTQLSIPAAAVGVLLGTAAHADGWPIPIGGSHRLAKFLIADIEAHGGRLETNHWITSLDEVNSEIVLADTSAKSLAEIAGAALPQWYSRKLKLTPYGMGITKIDVALKGSVPWLDKRLLQAGTVHIGGNATSIFQAEKLASQGDFPESPFVLLSQPSSVDSSRAPTNQSVLWAYARTTAWDSRDHSETLLSAIENHAPGFRDQILFVKHTSAAEAARENPNYVGGDIATGELNLYRLFARPVISSTPWRTPTKGLYLASAGVSPGPGVHGMSGFLAANTVLRDYSLPLPKEFRNL